MSAVFGVTCPEKSLEILFIPIGNGDPLSRLLIVNITYKGNSSTIDKISSLTRFLK